MGRKSEIATQYREHIGDEWTGLVEAVDWQCRRQWGYLIPDDLEQQQQLRKLCEETLGFENHFLAQYKAYLLTQLPQAKPLVQLRSVQRLGQLIYDDRAIKTLLRTFEQNPDPDIRQAATKALRLCCKSAIR